VLKPFTNIRDCKGSFFYIQNTIVLSEYPALLNEEFKYDRKCFNDPLPYQVRSDPLYRRLACHPVNAQTFPEPIFYMPGIMGSWEGSPLLPEIVHVGQSMCISFDCNR
jgi:hypothetical protein